LLFIHAYRREAAGGGIAIAMRAWLNSCQHSSCEMSFPGPNPRRENGRRCLAIGNVRGSVDRSEDRRHLVCESEPRSANRVQREKHAGPFRFATEPADDRIDSRVVKFVDVFVHGFDQRGPVEGLATLAQQASQNALFRSRQMKAVIHAVRENPATFYQRPARSTRWRG